MNERFAAAMRRAESLTRASDINGATRIIQEALGIARRHTPASDPEFALPQPRSGSAHFAVDPNAETVEDSTQTDPAPRHRATDHRTRMPLADAVRQLRAGRMGDGSRSMAMHLPRSHSVAPAIPAGATYETRTFRSAAGSRNYRLYIPASARGKPRGLVVMLHGCKQNPDDFANGTGMNTVAEENALLVAYPEQRSVDNASACWNWFRTSDQTRGTGEPAIIAGITTAISTEFGIGRAETFVAGLSAGGAMAAVMGEAYPDLFAAVGIHSGLPVGSASDVVTAFAAMRGDGAQHTVQTGAPGPHRVRTIVFHGSGDRTVHPSNAEKIVGIAGGRHGAGTREVKEGRSAGGRRYRRSTITNEVGVPFVEHWEIDGAGHAWAGGSAKGSYTDPDGPDASAEMVRFFLAAAG